MVFKRFRKLSKKKKLLVIVVIAIVVIFAFVSLTSSGGSKFITDKVKRGSITELVSETGIINSTNVVTVTSPSTGVVTDVSVKNGDVVKTGDTLFAIKSSATEQEKSLALANYLAAKSALDAANSMALKLQAVMFDKWDTFRELATNDTYETSDGNPKYENRSLPEFHIPEKQWLAAEQDYKQQQNVISQAKAAVSSTYLLYTATQNATVKATADGIIENLSVSSGSAVTASVAKPLALIAGSALTEVIVSLSEYSIAKVAENQSVLIDVKAVSHKKYHGFITRVDTVGSDVKGVMRYNAYMQIANADKFIRPGMSADITITTNNKTNVLRVPNSAVKPYQGGRAIRVPGKNGAITYVPVEIGVRGKAYTEIVKGVKENQEIITTLSNEQIKRPGLLGN
ncbi:MAG: efflux RND transporter periplasmic adaptor subunit [Patescibacteria group bacterium]|jgi:HlyD family secretion protein